VPHPVTLFGWAIDQADAAWNDPNTPDTAKRGLGMAVVAGGCTVLLLAGAFLGAVLSLVPLGWIVTAIIVTTLVAQRDLYDHVAAVRGALRQDDLEAARAAVGRIVGRDPSDLDESGVSKAAIESLAENFSDAVVAPVFWFAVLGLPGLLAYKFVNTADSMIGHRSERYREFGWAAARLDDLLNFIPARISAALITAAAYASRRNAEDAWSAARIEGRKHVSPNAGWPEAAMAGALGVALGGPRSYDGVFVDGAVMNEFGREDVSGSDIGAALTLFLIAGAIHAAVYVLLGFAFG
jgi:adenosylcobinamide-phosphate synthase